MKLYIDLEFTGLHQNTTPISIGIVAENEKSFYAEFKDFNRGQVDDWIQKHVINSLWFVNTNMEAFTNYGKDWSVYGDRAYVAEKIKEWLLQFNEVEFYCDTYAYDWVLFCELFGGAMSTPNNIYYIPFDLSTALHLRGYDPDISREEFSGSNYPSNLKHNSLVDADIIRLCWERLEREKEQMQSDLEGCYENCEYLNK